MAIEKRDQVDHKYLIYASDILPYISTRAVSRAGTTFVARVFGDGKNDQFWIDIGKFDTIFEYNEERIRERDIDALYSEDRFWFWSWDNTENRFFYDSKRIETREIEQNQLYFFAAIALNHLVSAINALRLANSYNRKLDELSLKFNIDYNPLHNQFSFSLQKSF